MEIYHSGEYVLPGVYKQVGGTRKLQLEQEDRLPVSSDGDPVRFERIRPDRVASQSIPALSSVAVAEFRSFAGKTFPK